jgi:hypothetical protein
LKRWSRTHSKKRPAPPGKIKLGADSEKPMSKNFKQQFMSKIIEIKEGQIIEGYDNYAAVEWCTPSVAGCSACISVTTSGNSTITLTITLKTPFGNYSKSFTVSNNICFTFQPVSKAKIELCVSNFKPEAKQICFTVGGKVCLEVPFFGWKCTPQFSHQFCVPLPGHSIHDKLETKAFDDAQLTSLIVLNHSLQTVNEGSCNCH